MTALTVSLYQLHDLDLLTFMLGITTTWAYRDVSYSTFTELFELIANSRVRHVLTDSAGDERKLIEIAAPLF